MSSPGSTRCSDGVAILGFPYAVFKRYYEDRGGWLGSLISYYGFFSLYPLLVAFTAWSRRGCSTIDRNALQRILEAVWSKVPFASTGGSRRTGAGAGTTSMVRHTAGSRVVSLLVSLWGAAGVVRVLQDAVNSMVGVPRYKRPLFLRLSWSEVWSAIIGLLGARCDRVSKVVLAGVTLAVDDLPVIAAIGAAVANVVLSVGDHDCRLPACARRCSIPRVAELLARVTDHGRRHLWAPDVDRRPLRPTRDLADEQCVFGPFVEHDRSARLRQPRRSGVRVRDRGQRRPGASACGLGR